MHACQQQWQPKSKTILCFPQYYCLHSNDEYKMVFISYPVTITISGAANARSLWACQPAGGRSHGTDGNSCVVSSWDIKGF